MGVFDDKKFEGFDWLSQATEPIESKLNEILGIMPDRVEIPYDLLCRIVNDGYFSNSIPKTKVIQVIAAEVSKNEEYHTLGYKESEMLTSCFSFEVEENTIIDFESKILAGKIYLVKNRNTFEDKDLEKIMGEVGFQAVSSMAIYDAPRMSRANEIMDLLGKCESGLKTRSGRNKQRMIKQRMNDIYKNNEWKLKDLELANKVGQWIRDYVVDGNLAAFSNFCRLKVMTHKGAPIYSMEEVK